MTPVYCNYITMKHCFVNFRIVCSFKVFNRSALTPNSQPAREGRTFPFTGTRFSQELNSSLFGCRLLWCLEGKSGKQNNANCLQNV